MFNLKTAQQDTGKTINQQLAEKREDWNQSVPDEGITALQLKHNSHKESDGDIPFNTQLEAARTGTLEGITEAGLNTEKKVYNSKRDDRTHNKDLTAPNLVVSALEAERYADFTAAQNKEDRDTSFWDAHVGEQMLGKKTKIVSNNQTSQLQNHPDRFKGLDPKLEGSKDFNELVKVLAQADKMQFHIFATAVSEGRKLTATETQKIIDINSGKAREIAGFEKAAQMAEVPVAADPF